MWFRDERRINITMFGQQLLILNATNQSKYEQYMNKAFEVNITA